MSQPKKIDNEVLRLIMDKAKLKKRRAYKMIDQIRRRRVVPRRRTRCW